MTIAQRGQRTLTRGPNWDRAAVRMLLATHINTHSHPRRIAFAFLGLRAIYRDDATVLIPDISVYVWDRIERDRSARGGIYLHPCPTSTTCHDVNAPTSPS